MAPLLPASLLHFKYCFCALAITPFFVELFHFGCVQCLIYYVSFRKNGHKLYTLGSCYIWPQNWILFVCKKVFKSCNVLLKVQEIFYFIFSLL